MAKLGAILQGDKLQDEIESMFRVRLTEDDAWRLRPRSETATPAIVRSSPLLTIPDCTAPRGGIWMEESLRERLRRVAGRGCAPRVPWSAIDSVA